MNPQPKLAVCLVDDDPDLRTSFKFLMKSSGIPLMTWASAEDFLANYEEKNVGCIVLDIRMPGMGGLELLESLRHQHVFIPVIILTAHADIPLTVRAILSGAMDVLEKP